MMVRVIVVMGEHVNRLFEVDAMAVFGAGERPLGVGGGEA